MPISSYDIGLLFTFTPSALACTADRNVVVVMLQIIHFRGNLNMMKMFFQLTCHQTSTLLHGADKAEKDNVRGPTEKLFDKPPLPFFSLCIQSGPNKRRKKGNNNGLSFVSVFRNDKKEGERRAKTAKNSVSIFHNSSVSTMGVLMLNVVPWGNQGQWTKKMDRFPHFFPAARNLSELPGRWLFFLDHLSYGVKVVLSEVSELGA